jgi:hypothetical protein
MPQVPSNAAPPSTDDRSPPPAETGEALAEATYAVTGSAFNHLFS